MFWELYQHHRIGQAQSSADSAAHRAGDNRERIREFEDRIDRLTLVNMAMWELLSEKLGVSRDELEQKIHDIDLSDGRLDGKVRVPTQQCPSCDRTLSKRHAKCMYCGQDSGSHRPLA